MDADSMFREQFPELCTDTLAEVISVDSPRKRGPEVNGATIQRELEQLERSMQTAQQPVVKAVPEIPPAQGPQQQSPGSLIAQQMEILGAEIRNIELALERERMTTRQYYDYAKAIELRMKALETQCASLNSQLVASAQKEASSNRIRSAISSELERYKTEIDRYRQAWQEISRRDQEARKAVQQWNAQALKLQEVSKELETLRQQYTSEKAKADLIEAQGRESAHKLAELERRAKDAEARATAKEQEYASLQDLCRSYEQRIPQMESVAADTLRNALETERRSYEEEMRIIRAQADARVSSEAERVRAEYERRFADQKSLYEERIGSLSREREITSQTAASRIGALEDLVSQDRVELQRFAEARAKIEQELRVREARVSALRSECQILQDVIVSEKSKYRQIADKLTDALIQIEVIDEIDPVILDELSEATRLQTVTSAQAEPEIEC